MNKSTLFIILIAQIFLYSCAGEASYDLNDDVSNNEYEEISSIKIETKIAHLTPDQLKSYETIALQKITDFFDHIKIMSDATVQSEFRNNSLVTAVQLLAYDTLMLTDSLVNNGNPILLSRYLQQLANSQKSFRFITHSVSITNSFTILDSTNCTGVAQVILSVDNNKLIKSIDIHLIESKKEFGESYQETIEVKLGNIY